MKKEKVMRGIIFAVVLLIPVIYSFFYLKSYWDPYGDLSGIKIAVVNLDQGEDGENQGKEFVEGLKDSDTFKICDASLDEANKGMQDGEYYAMILIPSNFTQDLNSASTTDKQIATITYSPNQASNYLASQIINSGVKTMEINLKSKINGKIAQSLATNLKSVPDSLEEILNGSGQILEGSKSLSSGIEQINTGVNTLNDSYTAFDNGVSSAYEGSVAVDNGLASVNSGVSTLSQGALTLDNVIKQINASVEGLSSQGTAGLLQLASGISKVNEGAGNLNTGVNNYADGAYSLASGTTNYVNATEGLVYNLNQYVDGVNATNSKVNNILTALAGQDTTNLDPQMQELVQQAQAMVNSGAFSQTTTAGEGLKQYGAKITESDALLKAGSEQIIQNTSTLKQGASNLYAGTQELVNGTSNLSTLTTGISTLQNALLQVQAGTTSLKDGINTLGSGVTTLKAGSQTLSNGLATLNSSSTQVKSALNTLSDGTNSAYEGSKTLTEGIETFNTQISEGLENTNTQLEALEGIESFSEDPVDFKTEAYGEVSSYGVAFTPLFLCIGLWVGALMCYVVLYYDQKNRFDLFDSKYNNKLLQNIVYIAVGAVEGITTALLLKVGLGFNVESPSIYYLSSMLIGITFMSIIQFLIRNFGDIGKFLSLIILVLQLAASGGTFPVETIDKFFQGISPYLPMTYSIKLLREILVPTATNFKGEYIMILVAITVVLFGIATVVDLVKKNKVKE